MPEQGARKTSSSTTLVIRILALAALLGVPASFDAPINESSRAGLREDLKVLAAAAAYFHRRIVTVASAHLAPDAGATTRSFRGMLGLWRAFFSGRFFSVLE